LEPKARSVREKREVAAQSHGCFWIMDENFIKVTLITFVQLCEYVKAILYLKGVSILSKIMNKRARKGLNQAIP
jgi:hypothetical protein